jgi:hypothetical protein
MHVYHGRVKPVMNRLDHTPALTALDRARQFSAPFLEIVRQADRTEMLINRITAQMLTAAGIQPGKSNESN